MTMAIPTKNTLALDSPRRPTEEDFGGTEQEDDALFPPNPKLHPTADGWKGHTRMLAAAWRMLPVCRLPITFSGSAPAKGVPQAGDPDITSTTFTLADNGPGDTTITWPADTFPASTMPPQAFVNDPAHGSWLQPTCEPVTNGVRVKTKNGAGVLTDIHFTISIF